MERRLARAKRGSNRRGRVRLVVARLKARETDRRKDWTEKASTDLARRFDGISVDIALIHDPGDFMGQAADEAYPALAELRAQGTVRAVGAGMNSPVPLAWLIERCDLDCVLVAGRYTLLDQSAAEVLFPLCLRRGVAVLAGAVFNSGILAGPDSGATYDYAPALPAVLDRARQMRDACARYGVPLPAALQFTLHHPAVTAVAVGARTATEVTTESFTSPVPYPTRSGLSWKRCYVITKGFGIAESGQAK